MHGERDHPADIRPAHAPGAAEVVVTRQQGTPIAVVSGEIDLDTVHDVRAHLLRYLDPQPGTLLIDLSAVTFLAAAGISMLLDVHHAAADRAIRVAVVAGGRATARPLSITGVDQVISIHPSRPAAILHLLRPRSPHSDSTGHASATPPSR
ncbi:anti-anti-sigma factor [Lentzea cavernae]|uniref:Anti-sigma factor antagonist n=1 Tax=Lentzea cavernae TaxID=2020703 RepID=A0ABQ3M3S1_9PSEU|nr:anti-anti-sigma factor [Lentzea cavernae]